MMWSNRLSLQSQQRSKTGFGGFIRLFKTFAKPATVVLCLISLGSESVLAQSSDTTDLEVVVESPTVVQGSFVILDPERLYAETAYGLRVQEELKDLALKIQAENGKLTLDLETEELLLLEQRALISPEEFRDLADAFDEKVQGIRDAQERKGQELSRLASEGRQSFNEASLPILRKILSERKALGILDSRVILLPDPSIDITNEAILRVDQILQDGKP